MFHIIVNRSAKSGKGDSLWAKIENVFIQHNVTYIVYETSKPGHAKQYVKEIMKKSTEEDTIVIVGGDGTFNEAVNGCEDFSKVKFGYIPNGSANDFARCMKIGTNVEKIATTIIENKRIKYVDVGEATFGDNVRKFIVSAGIGFDAQICAEVNKKSIKNILNTIKLGKIAYGLIGLKLVFTYKPLRATLSVDNNEKIKLNKMLFTSIHIQTSEGGGYPFCPDAKCSDGLFDTCSVYGMSKLREIMMFPLAKTGKHINHKGIKVNRGENIVIKTNAPATIHTDGETYGQFSQITVTPCVGKMKLVVL